MYSTLFLVALAFGFCYFLTPLVRIGSCRLGVLDHPKAGRSVHVTAVPRTGGVAILLAYFGAIAVLLASPLRGADEMPLGVALQLLPAMAAVFALGLIDDVVGLDARTKLIGQVAAASVAYASGVQVTGVSGYLAPSWAGLPITILWLVACANAVNLIDGMDGLAAGIGLFATFTMMSAALFSDHMPLALATAPLLGALLAFLRYNFNPASIFLGDCGSLTIGFLLGCFGAIWSQKSVTLVGVAAPLMALAVPLVDTGIAVARRFLSHRPIFGPDRNHLHHRLLERGFSARKVALILYGACGVAAAFSLLLTMPSNRLGGVFLIAACGAAWIGVQLAGYVELDTARHLLLSGTFRHLVSARLFVARFERRIAAAVTADDYWETIREVGREFECAHIRMVLRGSVFEQRDPERERQTCCTMRVPLSANEYVNFTYATESSVRHAVAISSVVEILQRPLAAGLPAFRPRPTRELRRHDIQATEATGS